MGIAVERDGDSRVPQLLGHDFHIRPCLQCERRSAVPKVMESDPAQTEFLQRGNEVARNVGTIQRFPALRRGHEVALVPVGAPLFLGVLISLVLSQGFHNEGGK